MSREPACGLCRDDCAWGVVLALEPDGRTASVEIGGSIAVVALDLVPGTSAGDMVLVQHGFALERRGPR